MTRYAIISDIHSNLHALEAVLARIETSRVDEIICLGDIVGYGPSPAKCIDLVFRSCSIIVQGNHDLAAVDPRYTEGFNPTAKMALDWTRQTVTNTHLEMLHRLREIEFAGDEITCVHDNPMPGPMGYIYDQQVASLAFGAVDTPICLVGHTHIPIVFEAPSARVEDLLESQDITGYITRHGINVPLKPGHRYICNPGSVGQPRDCDPRASFGILDTGDMTFMVNREAYDIAGAQLAAMRSGLPPTLADRLALGA